MRRSNLGAAWGSVLLVSLILIGCPLDTRTLRQEIIGTPQGGSKSGSGGGGSGGDGEEGGIGGDPGEGGGTGGSAAAGDGGSGGGAGGMSGGAGNGGSSGGASGSGGTGGGPVSDCPDLDENARPDCDETLVMNAQFDTDAENWVPDDQTEREWIEMDAAERMNSGSVRVSNLLHVDQDGMGMAGSKQCVAVNGGGFYRFLAEVSVPGGQNGGNGAINLLFFANLDCTGSIEGATTSALSGTADWTVLDASTQVPGRARSVLVRLVAVKPFRSTSLQVRFDNVLVRSI